MANYLGIDLGTSSVKVVLVNELQDVIDQVSIPLGIARPHPLWSEQDPEEWWLAVQTAMATLKRLRAKDLSAVKGIGLTGQMHGATLLGRGNHILRPAILWNDGRSGAECVEFERRAPRSRQVTGNLAMPGFTAPKLIWVARHEPKVFSEVAKVLLPKDFLRLKMCGNFASDMSDSAGTLWMDTAKRKWSEELLAATELPVSAMPELFEGTAATGTLSSAIASEWGVPRGTLVAAGGGDNAAGAAGVGVVRHGEAFLSLGTSGVYFTAKSSYSANAETAVHTFCHCLPDTWHQMSVILSAASCLAWAARLTGAEDEASLLAELESIDDPSEVPIFLPYLSGERTPHNDPGAQGVFFGLTHGTTRATLGRAVLEGVAFAFADGQRALLEAGSALETVSVIGGGARSALWGRILAAALGRPLIYRKGAEIGPAFGAARLGRLAATGENPRDICVPPPVDHVVEPDAELAGRLAPRLEIYRNLYPGLKSVWKKAGKKG